MKNTQVSNFFHERMINRLEQLLQLRGETRSDLVVGSDGKAKFCQIQFAQHLKNVPYKYRRDVRLKVAQTLLGRGQLLSFSSLSDTELDVLIEACDYTSAMGRMVEWALDHLAKQNGEKNG